MKLLLFFSYGVSLKDWAESGLIDREIQLYKKLEEMGVEVTFVTYGDKSDYNYQAKLGDIKIVPFYENVKKPRSKILAVFHSLLLPFILKDHIRKNDIVKANQMTGSWTALISKFLYKKKMILRCGYELYVNLKRSKCNRSFILAAKILSFLSYKFSDRIIVTTKSMNDFIVKSFKANKKKISILPNFIDTDQFRPLSDNRNCKILFIGRLSHEKNIYGLLDAVSNTDYGIDIIGKGKLADEINDYIEKNKIQADLIGTFPNSQIHEVINKYPAFVLPSNYEWHPKALLEAMACGLAVIGTDVDGVRDIIKNNENGILCENTTDSIREAIIKLMDNKQLCSDMGKKARQFVVDNCSIDYIAGKEYDLYNQLIGKT